jgi:nucleoside-diphosphate-sugar epimerase
MMLDTAQLGVQPNLTMPSLSVTVGEQIEALGRVAGSAAVKLIRRRPDAAIDKIVRGWGRAVDARRARALGFVAETSFDEIVRGYIDEEMPAH